MYIYQRHHPGEQNRKEECYGVDPTDGFDEEQYNIQSTYTDWSTYQVNAEKTIQRTIRRGVCKDC